MPFRDKLHGQQRKGPTRPDGDAALIQRLQRVVSQARSIQEIEDWLRAQAWVEDVRTEDYILKSNPPRRVLTIMSRQPRGSTQRYQLIVVELPDDTYRIWELRKT